jgi:hypothetical protein
MGKRELLLIGAFVVVGLVAWRLTAPPAEPGARRFSLQRTLDNIRSELQSHDTPAEVSGSAKVAVPSTITRVDLGEFYGTAVIEGTDGDEVVADLRGTVFGPDETQAKAFAVATVLRSETATDTVRLTVERPELKHLPRLELKLKVPQRLVVEVTMSGGRLEVRRVAGLEYEARRTTVLAGDVHGLVKGDQRDGDVEIQDVQAVDLTTRRVDVRVERVSGNVKGEPVDGNWLIRDVGGSVALESERADLSVERVAGTLTFNVSDGDLTLRDEVGDVRGESRRCRLVFRITGTGALDVTAEDAPVELQVDATVGARYDLRAEDAAVRAPEGTLSITTRDTVSEATGTMGPGRRTVKVRSRRGDITVRP